MANFNMQTLFFVCLFFLYFFQILFAVANYFTYFFHILHNSRSQGLENKLDHLYEVVCFFWMAKQHNVIMSHVAW